MIRKDRHGTLSRFSAVLFDLNGTHVWRGPVRTRARLPCHLSCLRGTSSRSARVHTIVAACCEHLTVLGRDPEWFDAFPQVVDALQTLPDACNLPLAEILLLERVIASHEVGRIPDEDAAVKALAVTHRLGVASNIWSAKQLWLMELQRAGILELFDVVVFSSQGTCIKPSPTLFNRESIPSECPAIRSSLSATASSGCGWSRCCESCNRVDRCEVIWGAGRGSCANLDR
jgi:putative hydrolase of the HAD superfamily